MDARPSAELLDSAHSFPGVYKLKAIGRNADDFEARLLVVVREVLDAPSDLDSSVRTTEGGRHIAVTLNVHVRNAEQVRTLYEKIHGVEGLLFLL